MDRKVISLISAKGGSGKTILTATLGRIISEIGYKVLIIDADAATNGLTLFYLNQVLAKKAEAKNESRGLFDNNFFLHSNQIVNLSDDLKFLPATFTFKNTIELPEESFESRISKIIEGIDKYFKPDVILIDNQAGSEHYTKFVIQRNISNQILIVSEYDPISAAGIERLKGFFNNDLTYDRTWIVLNKVLPEFKDTDTSFLEISKYLPPIIWNSEVVRHYSRKEVPLDFKIGNTYTLSIIKLIKTLFGTSINEELNSWLDGKDDLIRKPIYDEYAKIKSQIIKYEENDNKAKQLTTIDFLYMTLLSLTFIIAVLIAYTMYSSLQSKATISLLVITLLSVILLYIFRIRFSSHKNSKGDSFKYEKEALYERLKEIELLKQSSLEEILKGKKNA